MDKKRVIVLGVIGILIALGLSLLLLSMREAGGGLADALPGSLRYRQERLDEEIARLDAVEPALAEAAGDFAALEKENALAAALAPDKLDFEATERHLVEASRKAGVDLASVAPEDEPVRVAGNVETWRVHVVVAGNFDQVAAFVDAVENPGDAAATAPGLIDVTDLSLVGDDADDYHECALVLQLYRYEDNAATPDSPPASEIAELLAAERSRYASGGRDPLRRRQDKPAAPIEEPSPEPTLPEAPTPEVPVAEAPASSPPEDLPEEISEYVPEDIPEEGFLPGLRVDGVSWSADAPRAVVNGAIYRAGDSVADLPGLRIESILPNAVVFDRNGERVRVPVRMFGGGEIR